MLAFQVGSAMVNSYFILVGSRSSTLSLNNCLGRMELNFGKSGNIVCLDGNKLDILLCKYCLMIQMILTSNIPEAFILYPCFKRIKHQIEKSKDLVGKQTFSNRKK